MIKSSGQSVLKRKNYWPQVYVLRNGEACGASPTCFWSSLINFINTYVVFYLSCIISRFNGEKTAKQMKSRGSFVRTS